MSPTNHHTIPHYTFPEEQYRQGYRDGYRDAQRDAQEAAKAPSYEISPEVAEELRQLKKRILTNAQQDWCPHCALPKSKDCAHD